MRRRDALALLGAVPALARCSGNGRRVRVGSKNFTESFVIAEIYAQSLEAGGIAVDRRFNLGSTQIAIAAMQRGDIDLYPEYTGTALLDVLHLPPMSDARAIYETVKRDFAQRYRIAWLPPSPMNDSQGLATTTTIAQRERLSTLSQLAVAAPSLRLATIPEFVTRADGLPGLQKAYGGFAFKSVKLYDISLKYDALVTGRADVATAFTTDGAIVTDKLVVLRDDKHFWPAYNVAPVVRDDTLARLPQIATILDGVSPKITDRVAARMNADVEGKQADPIDVAAAFLKGAYS